MLIIGKHIHLSFLFFFAQHSITNKKMIMNINVQVGYNNKHNIIKQLNILYIPGC
jgi:hypothetical protein